MIFRLFRNRIRSSVKRPGLVMGVTALLLLLSAWNTGENLLYIMLGGVASLMVLSGVLSRINLRGLTLKMEAPHAVFRGEPFMIRALLQNPRKLLPAISVRVEDPSRPGASAAFALKVPPRRAVQLDVEQVFDRRGVYTLPGYHLASSFPFGFSESRLLTSDTAEVLVYPRIHQARTAVVEQAPGARWMPRSRSNDGDEYMSLREYLPGDDIRLIAWRVSARVGVWMVREMGFGSVRSVVFLLDTVRHDMPGYEERFEEAVELAASLAVTMLGRQYSVGIAAADGFVSAGKGTRQERKILDMMARVQPGGGDDAEKLTLRAVELRSEPVRLVCISPNPEAWASAALPEHMKILDPAEAAHG